ncbi:MAG: TolC family protein [Flavobacteriia bacterium]|nr:TolC family protein [Flavobacteriia bacterium]
MKKLFLFLWLFTGLYLNAQSQVSLSFKEFVDYVQNNHPLATKADNRAATGLAQLLEARGAFDPKINLENDQKTFDNKEYFNSSNGALTIPTWYGVSLKAGYSQNEGVFINPEEQLPENGLYQAGIEIDASEGLWINKRLATLRQAKFSVIQTKAERDLLLNNLIAEAATAYFNWLLAYENFKVSDKYLSNAQQRFLGVRDRALAGDLATIDTTESYTNVQQRMLERSQALLEVVKSRLEASNYLWAENTVPLEIAKEAIPQSIVSEELDLILGINEGVLNTFFLGQHPKITMLNAKLGSLEVDRSLKQAALLPDLKINFNLLQTETNAFIPINTDQYKAGFKMQLPLFLRKERGALKLSNLKISDAQMDLRFENIKIQNKVSENYQAQDFLLDQFSMSKSMVVNYRTLLSGEQQKFNEGESSLFVVISREQKLIEAILKRNSVENKFYKAKIGLYKALALPIN